MRKNFLMMLIQVSWPLTSLGLLAGCNTLSNTTIQLEDKEVCVYSNESEMLRCAYEDKNYVREIKGGDIVTNHVDYIRGVNELVDLIKKLKECQSGSRL